MLTPSQKGSIAEAAIVAEAVKLGIGVYRPVNEGLRCDLIFDVRGRLLRVQCKWAPRRGDVIPITCRTCRRTRDGYLRTIYTSAEIDAFAAYCPDLDRCYFLPLESYLDRRYVWLRLNPTKNNQQLRVNWAEDAEFAATLGATEGP